MIAETALIVLVLALIGLFVLAYLDTARTRRQRIEYRRKHRWREGELEPMWPFYPREGTDD